MRLCEKAFQRSSNKRQISYVVKSYIYPHGVNNNKTNFLMLCEWVLVVWDRISSESILCGPANAASQVTDGNKSSVLWKMRIDDSDRSLSLLNCCHSGMWNIFKNTNSRNAKSENTSKVIYYAWSLWVRN